MYFGKNTYVQVLVCFVILAALYKMINHRLELYPIGLRENPQRWSGNSIEYDPPHPRNLRYNSKKDTHDGNTKRTDEVLQNAISLDNVGIKKRSSVITNMKTYPWHNCSGQPRSTTREVHDLYIDLVEKLVELFDAANVSYVIGSGSMIGSYAFHDMIPWDDDVDVWVDYRDLPKVKRIFREQSLRQTYGAQAFWNAYYSGEYDLSTLLGFPEDAPDEDFYRWNYDGITRYENVEFEHHAVKFFRNDGKSFFHFPWRWPYIDISYFRQNKTHVWNHKPVNTRPISIPKQLFYPIVRRPMAWLLVPAPYNIREIIQHKYGHFNCTQHTWDHIRERKRRLNNRKSVLCSELLHYYPIVWPGEWRDGFQEEHLLLRDVIIQSVWVQAPLSNESIMTPRSF